MLMRPAWGRVVSAALLLLGLGACGTAKPTTPSPTPTSNAVKYTVIGASDAIGFGSSAICIPLIPCPNGNGYVQVMGRRFTAEGKALTLVNLGLPGAVLSPWIEAIGDGLGRDVIGNFLEREVPFVPRDSTLVTVFAGANDANTIGAALQAGLGGSNPAAYVATQVQNFGRDMRALITGIRDRAASTRIVILNLPNMAALPYASGLSTIEKQALQAISVGFSTEINALTAQGALIVDLMCNANMYQPGIYSGDGFHPNDTGYARLADLVYLPASTGSGTPPRASCPQMTIF
jgi:lysophospholipase L1-like esterase